MIAKSSLFVNLGMPWHFCVTGYAQAVIVCITHVTKII